MNEFPDVGISEQIYHTSQKKTSHQKLSLSLMNEIRKLIRNYKTSLEGNILICIYSYTHTHIENIHMCIQKIYILFPLPHSNKKKTIRHW